MAGTTGSFGLLKLSYEVVAGRVTVKRNVWLPFALLGALAVGIYLLVQTFTSRHFDGGMFAPGFICTMVGLFALYTTPWLTPGRVTVTHEGIVWRGRAYPPQAIASINARSTELRSGRYGRYLSWGIAIVTVDRKLLLLPLGDHQLSASTEKLMTLERAMIAVLSRRA